MVNNQIEKRLKIGVLKADNIGDAVLASPFFYGLRKHFKNAEITGILSPAGEQVLGGLGIIDNIEVIDPEWLSYKKVSRFKRLRSALKAVKAINKYKFDILVGMRHQDRLTSLILSFSNAKKRIGYDVKGMGFGLDKKIKIPGNKIHQAQKNMQLLYHVTGKMYKEKFGVSIDKASELNVKKVLAKGKVGKFVLLHPVSGHISKDWGIDNYKILSRLLARRGKVIIAGSKEDEGIMSLKGKNIVNLSGMLTIRELAAMIKKASIVIGNDSAAVHIASALNVKALTLFSGAAKYEEWGALGRNTFIMHSDTECRGCELIECNRAHECMDFDPEEVLAAVNRIRSGKQKKKMISL